MNDELGRPESSRTARPRGRGFRRHELALADGGRLILRVDGAIERVDALGATTKSWTPDDPAWPDQAIRFGLHPQVSTVTPQGRRVQGPNPPGR